MDFNTQNTFQRVKSVGDTISRQAAIDALGDEPEVWRDDYEYAQGLNNQWHYDVNALKALPSAQPERKTGKWIEKEVYETRRKEEMQVAKCSNCEKYLTTPYIYSFNHYNYCPHCGAKM